MLNLVPFAGPGRKVANRNLQAKFIGQLRQFDLPQPRSAALAPTRVSRHQQFSGFRVGDPAHLVPPAPDRLHGKLRRVMIDPDTDPPFVAGQLINSIRDSFAQLRVFKLMNAHLDRVSRGAPRLAGLLAITDQFFLFRVNRNDRLATFLKRPHVLVHGLELLVPIRMIRSCFGFAIGLQAIVHLMKQIDHRSVAHLMPPPSQIFTQVVTAFRGPLQGRLRIAAGREVKQLFQVALQSAISLVQRLAPTTWNPYPRWLVQTFKDLRALQDLFHPSQNGIARQTGRFRYGRSSTPAERSSFSSGPMPSNFLVHYGSERFILLAYLGYSFYVHHGDIIMVA